MIALLNEHVIDLLPLRREPQTARGQALVQIAIRFFLLDQTHLTGTLDRSQAPVNT
jgi:hypothetical protein